MKKLGKYTIQLRPVEDGFEAQVPQLNVTATGATRDEAVDKVLMEAARVLEAAELKQKKTVA